MPQEEVDVKGFDGDRSALWRPGQWIIVGSLKMGMKRATTMPPMGRRQECSS